MASDETYHIPFTFYQYSSNNFYLLGIFWNVLYVFENLLGDNIQDTIGLFARLIWKKNTMFYMLPGLQWVILYSRAL